jgi:hypothetical protein
VHVATRILKQLQIIAAWALACIQKEQKEMIKQLIDLTEQKELGMVSSCLND